jgi:CBS domain-containing protein
MLVFRDLDPEVRRFHRDELRRARTAALDDAEGFLPIIQALERLGRYLMPGANGLGPVQPALKAVAEASPLFHPAPDHATEFDVLYEIVRRGRNDALHDGAFARNLTQRSIELALLIEEGLMAGMDRIADFMVRSPVMAEPWHPVSFARQQMLLHSFSFLPLKQPDGWYLLSDWAVACFLAKHGHSPRVLSRHIGNAVDEGELGTTPCVVVAPEAPKSEVVVRLDGKPAVVVGDGNLLGIVTPFDLL